MVTEAMWNTVVVKSLDPLVKNMNVMAVLGSIDVYNFQPTSSHYVDNGALSLHSYILLQFYGLHFSGQLQTLWRVVLLRRISNSL